MTNTNNEIIVRSYPSICWMSEHHMIKRSVYTSVTFPLVSYVLLMSQISFSLHSSMYNLTSFIHLVHTPSHTDIRPATRLSRSPGYDEQLVHLCPRWLFNLHFIQVTLKAYSQQFRLLFTIAAFLFLDAMLLCNAHSHIMDGCCLLHLAELCTLWCLCVWVCLCVWCVCVCVCVYSKLDLIVLLLLWRKI